MSGVSFCGSLPRRVLNRINHQRYAAFVVASSSTAFGHSSPANPELVAQSAFTLLDALYAEIGARQQAEREYSRGKVFQSRFGPAYGIESPVSGVRRLAERRGARVFVFVDPIQGFRGYKARSQDGIDFGTVYEQLREIEPDADWFLHESRELLLCGSPKAPDRRLSKLPLEALVTLISPRSTARQPSRASSLA